MKNRKTTDERILQLNNKIQSEAYRITLFIALASLFTKQYVLDLPLARYAVELSIVILSLAYVVLRSMLLGHSLMDTSKGGKKLTIFSISIASLIIAIINGMKNYALYGNKYAGIFDGHFIAVNVITFLSAFLFIAVVFAVLYWSNQRGQQRIEKKLKEEDEESE